VALFKLATNIVDSGMRLEQILRDNHARILSIEKEFLIIEKTGQGVAITKPMKTVEKHIEELQLEKEVVSK